MSIDELIGVFTPVKHDKLKATEADFLAVADELNCEVAAIKAVFEVEAANKFFTRNKTLPRRFEPHKLGKMGFKESLGLDKATRTKLFRQAAYEDLNKALSNSSWGAPQIMGFNHKATGQSSAEAMVQAMARGAGNQLRLFGKFLTSNGWDTYLRSHDWHGFARKYNGPARAEVYGERIAAAYRKHNNGERSQRLLRVGVHGPDVRELQLELTAAGYPVVADGHFGPQTEAVVRRFQLEHALKSDGIVGAKTREMLDFEAEPQRDAKDTIVEAAGGLGALTAFTTALGSLGDIAQIVAVMAAILVLGVVGYMYWRQRDGYR